jgi:hypothetical protein
MPIIVRELKASKKTVAVAISPNSMKIRFNGYGKELSKDRQVKIQYVYSMPSIFNGLSRNNSVSAIMFARFVNYSNVLDTAMYLHVLSIPEVLQTSERPSKKSL